MSKNNKDAVIIDGFRTPFVISNRNFKNMSAEQLGAWLLRELLERTQVPINEIDGLILGNTSATENIAPSIALKAGLHPSTPATTLKQMDLSSLESIISAVTKIKYGLANTLIAGGVENMSQTLVTLNSNLTKIRKEVQEAKKWKDKIKYIKYLRFSDIYFPFTDDSYFMNPALSLNQKKIAEALSEEFYISREEQDEYTKLSFEKASLSQKSGKRKEEVVPVFPPADFEMVQKDFHLDHRIQTLYESEPYFKHGTVTSGNSSFYADGAAFLLIMSREKAESLGYQPLVSIHSVAYAEKSQKKGLGAVYATAKVLEKSNLNLEDVGLLEINEDFSAQTLACFKAFESSLFNKEELGRKQALGKIKPEKYNVNGGSLALGHPVSATIARMVLNLAKEMNTQNVKWGLTAAGMCEGQAGALLLKNEGSL